MLHSFKENKRWKEIKKPCWGKKSDVTPYFGNLYTQVNLFSLYVYSSRLRWLFCAAQSHNAGGPGVHGLITFESKLWKWLMKLNWILLQWVRFALCFLSESGGLYPIIELDWGKKKERWIIEYTLWDEPMKFQIPLLKIMSIGPISLWKILILCVTVDWIYINIM